MKTFLYREMEALKRAGTPFALRCAATVHISLIEVDQFSDEEIAGHVAGDPTRRIFMRIENLTSVEIVPS